MLAKIISKNLKAIRAKKGVSQKKLSDRSKPKLSLRYITRLENEAPNVSVDVLETLAKALECSVVDLVTDKSVVAPNSVLDDLKVAILVLRSVQEQLEK